MDMFEIIADKYRQYNSFKNTFQKPSTWSYDQIYHIVTIAIGNH